MNIGKPHLVETWKMFTLSGKPVYAYGVRGFSLDKGGHRIQALTMDCLNKPFNVVRLARAAEQVGESCEWVPAGKTEVMDVYF